MFVEAAILTRDSGVFEELRNVFPLDFLAVLPIHFGDLFVPVFGVRIVLNVDLVFLSKLVEFDEVGDCVKYSDGVFDGHSSDRHHGREHHGNQKSGNRGGCAETQPRRDGGGKS